MYTQMKAIIPLLYCYMLLNELTRPVYSFLPNVNLMRSTFNSNSNHNRNCFHTALEASVVTPSPQLLEFREPLTNVTVVLIGSMHYNPTSINLVSQTIEDLGQKNSLGSVVIESCDIRWNKTLQLRERTPFLKSILGSEMGAAQEKAFSFDLPVVLGDQRINITSAALKGSFKSSLIDLVTPPDGWRRFKDDVTQAWDEAVPSGDSQYLSPLAFLDPKLLIATPVSLVKYPLSFFIRSPIPTSIVFALLFGLSYVTNDAVTFASVMEDPSQITLFDYAINLFFAVLETVVFARVLLKPLLADRNVVLAENILQQCKLYTAGTDPSSLSKTKKGANWFWFLTNNEEKETNADQSTPNNIVYAAGSSLANTQVPDNGTEKVVVAVLGMAHLNGVMKLLKEQKL